MRATERFDGAMRRRKCTVQQSDRRRPVVPSRDGTNGQNKDGSSCRGYARARRLEAYARPQLRCIDEVGYLSYDVRHADLLFEVVARRHEKDRAIVLTTNKAFAEWHTTFPNASCVVAFVDRLINRADIVAIDGDSYRLREAEERQKVKATARKTRKDRPPR